MGKKKTREKFRAAERDREESREATLPSRVSRHTHTARELECSCMRELRRRGGKRERAGGACKAQKGTNTVGSGTAAARTHVEAGGRARTRVSYARERAERAPLPEAQRARKGGSAPLTRAAVLGGARTRDGLRSPDVYVYIYTRSRRTAEPEVEEDGGGGGGGGRS